MKKILIFEDNASIQALLRFFFKKKGIEAYFNDDGTQAVQSHDDISPDLILMDYIMPGKDGIEAALDLRAAGIKTPIVMLTSKSFDTDRQRAAAAGIDAYLTKPFNPAQLDKAIQPYLGS